MVRVVDEVALACESGVGALALRLIVPLGRAMVEELWVSGVDGREVETFESTDETIERSTTGS